MTEFIDIDGMVDGEFGDWQIAIAINDTELIIQYKRRDDEPVTTWGPSYDETQRRGTVKFVKATDEGLPLVAGSKKPRKPQKDF